MTVAMIIMLCLLAFLPTYGVGYILNTWFRFWPTSIILYVIILAVITILYGSTLSAILWVLIGVMGVACILSATTVKSFKRGSYKKIF